jgi:rubrerythrin
LSRKREHPARTVAREAGVDVEMIERYNPSYFKPSDTNYRCGRCNMGFIRGRKPSACPFCGSETIVKDSWGFA